MSQQGIVGYFLYRGKPGDGTGRQGLRKGPQAAHPHVYATSLTVTAQVYQAGIDLPGEAIHSIHQELVTPDAV